MADNQKEIEDKIVAGSNNFSSILDHPLVKEMVIPIVKQSIKKEFGIETHEKEITKKAFGRFVYALRDFIQGTWWVVVLFTFMMGVVLISLMWIRKAAGV